MPKIIDLSEKRFGKLTVVQFSHRAPPHTYWECMCDCGGATIASTNNLHRGRHASCGCGHGMSRTPEYECWYNMKLRCGLISGHDAVPGYENVTVDPAWYDFKVFLNDVGFRPTKNHSIDRINPLGMYEKLNVRWATDQEQARNKTNHPLIKMDNGSLLHTWEYAKTFGCTVKAAWQRAKREGRLMDSRHYRNRLIATYEGDWTAAP